MRVAIVLAAVLLAVPAQAKPWQCVLYPKTCQAPATVQTPAPEPPAAVEPIQAAPPVVAPLPAPRPAIAKSHPKPAAKPVRVKSKFKKKRYTAAELAAMPGLIWPCWVVRAKTAGKSKAQLIAEGRAQGISLNPRQIKEVCECGVAAACGSA